MNSSKSRKARRGRVRYFKPAIFLSCVVPAAWLVYAVTNDAIGADPIKGITLFTGLWGLRFVLITLTVTPLRRVTGWHWLLRYRRMLGLFACFYLGLHFATYLVLDQSFNWPDIIKDLTRRPYIIAGFSALVLLTPLAITSTKGWIRRLGGRNWQRLHRLVYVAASLGCLHFLWLVKSDISQPMLYIAILAVLLFARLVHRWRQRSSLTRKVQASSGAS